MEGTVMTDAALMRQLAAGDEAAFQSLYKRYWNGLYEYVVYKVQYQESGEEIVQDIFIDLWRRREHLIIDNLESYLFRAAKNRVLDFIRASIVRRHREESIYAAGAFETQRLDSDEQLAYGELQAALKQGLDILPEKTREIFRLNRLEQFSAREIAGILEIPERTVEYHITNALKVMRVYLQDFLVTLFFVLPPLQE